MKKLLAALLLFSAGLSYADINVTEGSGKTVATDSVSSKEYQKIKLCDGAAGTSTCFSTAPVTMIGAIQLASGTLNVSIPGAVQLASGTLTVAVPGAIQLASGTLTVS